MVVPKIPRTVHAIFIHVPDTDRAGFPNKSFKRSGRADFLACMSLQALRRVSKSISGKKNTKKPPNPKGNVCIFDLNQNKLEMSSLFPTRKFEIIRGMD